MILQRLPSLGLLAVLPLLTACNQTTASSPVTPSATAEVAPGTAGSASADPAMGSGVRAALADAQATREQQNSTMTALGVVSFFDPIGVTDIAEPIMKAQHQREAKPARAPPSPASARQPLPSSGRLVDQPLQGRPPTS